MAIVGLYLEKRVYLYELYYTVKKWLFYLIPRTLVITGSRYNKHIRVNEEHGQPKLLVNGTRESGESVELLWKHAFSHLGLPKSSEVHTILVIGVAGGTVIHMLRNHFPNAPMMGIDIDPLMIDIGKKYFHLNTVPLLQLVPIDARKYVKQHATHQYDIIILDVYIGADLPDFLLSEKFHSLLRTLLSNTGSLYINYEYLVGYEEKVGTLRSVLHKFYKTVRSTDIETNRFFLVRR